MLFDMSIASVQSKIKDENAEFRGFLKIAKKLVLRKENQSFTIAKIHKLANPKNLTPVKIKDQVVVEESNS